ncbi:MAG: EAL domain-containing protein [Oscillospiraceae bacterium]
MDAARNYILIYDEDQAERAKLTAVFANSFTVFEAESSEAAISVLRAHSGKISYVIICLSSANSSGFAVLERISQCLNFCTLPVTVVLPAYDSDLEERAYSLGAVSVISKPYTPSVFNETVNTIIKLCGTVKKHVYGLVPVEEHQAQAMIDALLSALPIGVSVLSTDPKPKMLYQNEHYFKLLGHTPESVDDTYSILSHTSPYYRKKILRTIHEVTSDGKTRNLSHSFTRNNGSIGRLDATCIKVDFTDNLQPVLLVLLSDVSGEKAQREHERAINEQMRYRAEHDPLSGLYNQPKFCEETTKLIKSNPSTEFTLICWNMEHFSAIKDVLGNEAVTAINHEISNRFKKYLLPGNTYGRLDTSIFACCYPTAQFDLDYIQEHFTSSFENIGISYNVTSHFGVYQAKGLPISVEQMCDRATFAARSIKDNNLVRYAFYDASLQEVLKAEKTIEAEMGAALKNEQFVIYLQPIYSLSSGRPVAAEALVRWDHPTRGLIPPGEFIPIFEANGFITKLDYFVWEKVCKILAKRESDGKDPLPISVNLSRYSIYSCDIVGDFKRLVEKYKVPPNRLKLEITESAYVDNPEYLKKSLLSLQALGFEVLMDDFGSGYSSLNMLKDLPVNMLKIDMKFLENFEFSNRAGSIITSVIRMARWLGIPVVAEGVETRRQLDFLYSVGCDLVQGFYYSKPIPVSDFERLVIHPDTRPESLGETKLLLSDIELLFGGNSFITKVLDSVFGGIGFYEFTSNGLEVIRVNNGYYKIFGLTPNTLASFSSNVYAHIHPEDAPLLKQACAEAVKTGEAQQLVTRTYHADGHIVFVDLTINLIGGTALCPIISISFMDISAKQQNCSTAPQEK